MRKLEKFLKLLSQKEREAAIALIERILARKFVGLDIKKLVGYGDIYRVRKGDIRIIFLDSHSEVKILSIGRRNEGTYENL